MATEGTREGGSSMNRGQGKYFDREKRPGGGTRFQKSDRSGAPRGDRQAGGDRPPRGNGNRSYGEKSYGDRPYGDRPPRNERPNRNYGGAPKFPKKDEDEEDRGRRSKPSRPKESKPTIAIPDKNKVQMRLEKEQKSVKKKQNNKNGNPVVRSQSRSGQAISIIRRTMPMARMMIMRILMIGNKKAGTIQQFVWCLFACWYVVVLLVLEK